MANNSFDPRVIPQIPTLSNDELLQLESQVAAEFRDLGRAYIQARLVRINQMIDKLQQLIKVATANDKNWLKIYNFEIETINNITTNTEDLILVKDGVLLSKADLLKSVDEYEEELKEIFKNLQSPLDFDESLNEGEESKLPFPYLFDQVFADHKTNLKTIINEKDYQTKLLKSLSRSNSSILWKQYLHKLSQRKRQLLGQAYHELFQLQHQYHHHDAEVLHHRSQNYYKSVLSVNDMVRTYDEVPSSTAKLNTTNSTDLSQIVANNRDPNYANLDNMYLQKNKVELTSIRRNIINKFNSFNYSQDCDNENRHKRTKLNRCSGLSDSQIDQDLFLITKGIREKHGEIIDSDDEQVILAVDDNEEEYDDEDEEDEEDDEDDEEDDEGYDQYHEDDDEQDIGHGSRTENGAKREDLMQKYRQLLGVDKSPSPLSSRTLQIPPLEAFPNLL